MRRPLHSAQPHRLRWLRAVFDIHGPFHRLVRRWGDGELSRGSGLRPAAELYLAVVVLAALVSLAAAFAGAGPPEGDNALLILAFVGAVTLAGIRPLPFVAGTKLTLDTSLLVAAVLLFDPVTAMLIVGLGKLSAERLRRQPWHQTLFNTALTVLLAAGSDQLLAAGGWRGNTLALHRPELLLLLPALAVALVVLNALLVAVIIALQTQASVMRVWYRTVAGDGPADGLAHLAQVGLGVIVAGALQGHARPLVLLLVLAGAAFPALAHHLRERRRAEAALAHQASHDPLTDLPNRTFLLDGLARLLGPAGGRGFPVGLLFLDLDRFKFVNDSLGHEAGDALLVAVAGRLQSCMRPGDTVARLGGDEFVILLGEVPDPGVAERIADRVSAAFAVPIALDGHEVTVTVSIGIALARPGHATPTALLRDADVALRRAKAEGKARCVVYEPWMGILLRDRVALEAELRRALVRDELRLAYQPIIAVATGRIEGVEVLVRWEHPEKGILLPDAFVALAEETGLISPIGLWVLEAACRQGRAWQERFPVPPVVSVNLSARQFQQPDLVESIDRILRETGLSPNLLRLELTESAVMADLPAAAVTLRRLKGLGVQLALDDFGVGYSSLGSLRHFPIDLLKIDRSFVAGLERDEGDAAIVRAVVAMAPALGLRVAAEGVETRGQLARLRELGCELGQGYHFARPLPSEALTTMLDEASEASRRGIRRIG